MNTPEDFELQRYLRGLPAADPSAELRGRVLAANARRRVRRRWAVPMALAASVLLASLVLPTLRAPDVVESSPSAVADPALVAELRGLDRRLQSTYLVPASDAERELLWQARSAAESRMASGAEAPRLLQL